MRCLFAVVATALLCAACSEPPHKEMNRAQGAIDAARAAGADRYAPEEFRAATAALELSHDAVAERDYRLALARAIDASERAQEAASAAASGKARARSEAEAAFTAADTALHDLHQTIHEAQAARLPAQRLQAARRTAADAEAVLQKARAGMQAEDYLDVSAGLEELPARISAEIKALNEAVAARTQRPAASPRRRR